MEVFSYCMSISSPKVLKKVIIYSLLGITYFVLSLKSILKFNEWSVYTETNVVPQNEVRFPAMTFCPLPNGYKQDVLKVIIRCKNYAFFQLSIASLSLLENRD